MDHRFGEQRHIAGGTELARRVQTVHGHKGGVGQAHFLRIAVHQADKRVLAARHVVGYRDAGVVAGLNDDALVKIFYRHLHPRLEEHHRRAAQRRITGGPRIASDGHHISRLNLTRL